MLKSEGKAQNEIKKQEQSVEKISDNLEVPQVPTPQPVVEMLANLEKAYSDAFQTLSYIQLVEQQRMATRTGGFFKRLWHMLRTGDGLFKESSIQDACKKGLQNMQEHLQIDAAGTRIQKVWFNPNKKVLEVIFNEPVRALYFNRRDAIRFSQLLNKAAGRLGRKVS